MTRAQLLKYVFIYKKLIPKLIIKSSTNEKKLSKEKIKEINNYFNIIIYCKLQHTFFSLSLKSLYVTISVKRKRNLANNI